MLNMYFREIAYGHIYDKNRVEDAIRIVNGDFTSDMTDEEFLQYVKDNCKGIEYITEDVTVEYLIDHKEKVLAVKLYREEHPELSLLESKAIIDKMWVDRRPLTFLDFLHIAEYGNLNWKGSFTATEVIENADEYLCEYDYSIKHGKPTHTMVSLCELLVEDMDKADYADCDNTFDIETMQKILKDFIKEETSCS